MKVFASSSILLLLSATTNVSNAFAPNNLSVATASATSSTATATQQLFQIPTRTTSTTPTKTALQMAAFESTDEIELDVEERFGKCLDSLKKNLQTIRTGRANPAILDLVQVSYYGAPTPLNQMASISVPNSQQLQIDPFDKSVSGDIEKAIIESGLGLTPNNDGNVIRINIPPITEDRRKDLLKQCKALGEDGKVSVRNVRRDGIDNVKKLEKNGDISEDESKGSQSEISKITDKFVKDIDSIVSNKEKEVMQV